MKIKPTRGSIPQTASDVTWGDEELRTTSDVVNVLNAGALLSIFKHTQKR